MAKEKFERTKPHVTWNMVTLTKARRRDAAITKC